MHVSFKYDVYSTLLRGPKFFLRDCKHYSKWLLEQAQSSDAPLFTIHWLFTTELLQGIYLFFKQNLLSLTF